MTFNAPSFFAGIGTVTALLIVGFGGGVLVSGIISSDGPRESSKLERRTAEPAKPAVIASDPVTVAERRKEEQPPAQAAALPAQTQPAPPTQPQPTPPAQPQNAAAQAPQTPSPAADNPATQQQQPGTRAERPIRQGGRLGPQQPVALVQPPSRESMSRREARAMARETRRLESRRRRAERREILEARQRQFRQAQEGERAKPREFDEDERDQRREERPVFMQREGQQTEGLFGTPRFRFFGGGDDQ